MHGHARGVQAALAWGAGHAVGRAGCAAGRRAGLQADARQAMARGARQQALGRPGGDTAEGPAMTRPRLLRHGASARCASGHARPGRRQGVLAGSGWCTVHRA